MPTALLCLLTGLLAAVEVTDGAGRTVVLPAHCERIVLVRGRDIYALALLLGDEAPSRLVGWGADLAAVDADANRLLRARYPGLERVPVLGNVFQDALSVEAVVALRPDLVVVDTFMLGRGLRCMERLQRTGLPLLYLDYADPWTSPQRSLRVLGQALSLPQRAEAVAAAIDAELELVRARTAGAGPGPALYMECGIRGPEVYGVTYGADPRRRSGTWGAVLDGIPCRNLTAALVAGVAPLRGELLLRLDPEIIVITGAGWTDFGALHLGWDADPAEAGRQLRAYAARPGWERLRAVRDGRLYGLYHGFAMHPTAFAGIQQLARWLHPQALADLDPEARRVAFLQRFLPMLPTGGAWAVTAER